MHPLKIMLILAIVAMVLWAISPAMVARNIEAEKEAIRKEIEKDSIRIDYNHVCVGVWGEDLKLLAQQRRHCR